MSHQTKTTTSLSTSSIWKLLGPLLRGSPRGRGRINTPFFWPTFLGNGFGSEKFKTQLLWTQVSCFANKQKTRKTLKIKTMENFEKYRKHNPPNEKNREIVNFSIFFFLGGGGEFINLLCLKMFNAKMWVFRAQSCLGGKGVVLH